MYFCHMRKIVLYLFVLIALGITAYFVVWKEKEETFSPQEANFNVENIDQIQSIFLSSLKGDNIILRKKGNIWMVNDSIPAIEGRINDLLEALQKQRVSQPVSLAMHDYVITELSSNNTKVEIYTAKGKTHCFYVGTNPSSNNLTYMLNEGAKRPYIVKLPLHNLFVGVRYSAKLSDWRSKRILYAKPEEIEHIEVRYRDSTHYSFRLELQAGQAPVMKGNYTIDKQILIEKVNNYVQQWDSIYCLGFEQRTKLKDTLFERGHLLAEVKMKALHHPEQNLLIYFKPISKGTKGVLKVGNEKFDFDLYFGLLNGSEMVLLNRHVCQQILRSYPEFYGEKSF